MRRGKRNRITIKAKSVKSTSAPQYLNRVFKECRAVSVVERLVRVYGKTKDIPMKVVSKYNESKEIITLLREEGYLPYYVEGFIRHRENTGKLHIAELFKDVKPVEENETVG